MHRKTWVGLIGVLGIWLTAGLALPFVNVLKQFSAEQLMVFRGFLPVLIVFLYLRGRVGGADRYTYWIGAVLPFATLGLFEGIRNWGAGPTIIVVTATPLVNFAYAQFTGKRLTSGAVMGLALMIAGVYLAFRGATFNLIGFLWSAFGTVVNGALYELFARTKSPKPLRMFWGSMGMGTLGLVLSFNATWPPLTTEPRLLGMVLGFALVGGLFYWLSNLIAFENLPTDAASVLAQGEAPAVIIMAGVLLGERFSALQWIGVLVALSGAWYLSKRLQESTAGS